ncbi:MAG: methionine ABC transporter ATP-binding protein [Coriobacteriia bacterium]|nr:methionine ABC transporter ATP-binding protein [Coriobacteriia bacterium]
MIEIQNVTKVYETREGSHTALKGVSMTINDGDIFGIIGESGAGKSTLVRCINMLEAPTSGAILIDGEDITKHSNKQLNEDRAGIGMIFQNFSLFQQRTVLKNVTYPLEIHGTDKATAEARAMELLKVVGLEGKEQRYPSELSGGQQQRVAIARALANRPKIMLCDEATSALDSRTTIQILDLLQQINRDLGVTMVVITHALAVAEQICNRIVVLDDGLIVEEGETADVFANPQADITRELLGHKRISSTLTEAPAVGPQGSMPLGGRDFPGEQHRMRAMGGI